MKIIFELPFCSPIVGGINFTIELAKTLGADVHFQNLTRGYPYGIGIKHTVGYNNHTECDLWITYSDNAHSENLLNDAKIKRVAVFMQSFGMSIANERKNALNPRILCLCTTKKIEEAIKRDGGNPINVGFGLDMQGFVDYGNERKNYLAIMYHDMPSKKYDVAVQVADILFDKGIIEGVISFGMLDNYKKAKHPKGLVAHYGNATKAGVADVFNQCKAYLMPSVSEGLNLTPIESTLCGCPAVICDGAIGEIFVSEFNCFIVKPNVNELAELVSNTISGYNVFSKIFKRNMQEVPKGYTWSNVANKIKDML